MKYLCLFMVMLFPLPIFAIDILGTDVTFGWTQGTGPAPEGYVVWVDRNGVGPANEQTVTEAQATVSGSAGETIVVTVQAYIGDVFSGMSPPSDPVTFQVLGPPAQLQIKCPPGQTFSEDGGGWWSCK
jgi:hypothetical protein